jgi:serine/threonine-protein kinase
VSQDPQVVKRFQQEAKTAAKLDHTNIIPIYRVESESGLNYFVMKYVAGISLEDALEQGRPLPADYIQRVLWEAALALGHAHQRGVVHRDVKPANIMFDHDGRVMLTDFGISKALQAASAFTGTGMIIGTPHYMAPEQAKGAPVDGRADQYALAVVGYRMVTGALPFTGDSVHTILYKHIFEEPPAARRGDVPPPLTAALARALAKEPDRRFASMEAFATVVWPEQPVTLPSGARPVPRRPSAVEAPTAVTGAPTAPLPPAPPGPPSGSRDGRRVGWGVAALLVAAIVGGGAYLARHSSDPARVDPPDAPSSVAPRPVADEPPARTDRLREAPPPRREPEPRAAASGFITVGADPFGTVYIDGVQIGPTPVVRHAVPPGRHTIRVERPGYRTITEAVQVDAGNVITKRYSLITEG